MGRGISWTLVLDAVSTRDGRRAEFCPGFANQPGNPGSGPGFGSKIVNSGPGLILAPGSGYPDENPEFFGFFKVYAALIEPNLTDRTFFKHLNNLEISEFFFENTPKE